MKENANGAMASLVAMFVQDLWNVQHVLQKQDLAAKDHQVIERQRSILKELKLHTQLMMQMALIGNWFTLTKLRWTHENQRTDSLMVYDSNRLISLCS